VNVQGKIINGKVVGGIEWTKFVDPDGTERRGYTWNPISGCMHACQWQMPDGAIANCYAEDVAHNLAQVAYPHGFEHHYWKPELLVKPGRVHQPSRIFVGSMADVFGHWVPADQIEQVIQVARDCPQHSFQFLTKNPLRTLQFDLPPNAWIGASSPPDFMWNKALNSNQKISLLDRSLKTLAEVKTPVRWMSFEPLSNDYAWLIRRYAGVLQWAVIGAASNGKTLYPPDEKHVRNLVEELDAQGVKVFFKGNLKSLEWAAQNWREEFPVVATPEPEPAPLPEPAQLSLL
jgi:protein gp37